LYVNKPENERKEAEQKFKIITQAYNVLSDDLQRQTYNRDAQQREEYYHQSNYYGAMYSARSRRQRPPTSNQHEQEDPFTYQSGSRNNDSFYEDWDPFEAFDKFHKNNRFSMEAGYFDSHRKKDFHNNWKHHTFYTSKEFEHFYKNEFKYENHREPFTSSEWSSMRGLFIRFVAIAGGMLMIHFAVQNMYQRELEQALPYEIRHYNEKLKAQQFEQGTYPAWYLNFREETEKKKNNTTSTSVEVSGVGDERNKKQ